MGPVEASFSLGILVLVQGAVSQGVKPRSRRVFDSNRVTKHLLFLSRDGTLTLRRCRQDPPLCPPIRSATAVHGKMELS